MRVLIVGCGYLGHRLARRWRRRGATVQALMRSTDSVDYLRRDGIEPIVADLDQPNAVARLEIRIVFEEVFARLGPWSVDEQSVERNQLIPGRGVACATVQY